VTEGRDHAHDLAWRWAEAVNQRDRETLLALSHPEIDLYPLQIAVSGHYRGPEGVARWMDELTTDDIGHHVRLESTRTLPDGRIALVGEVYLEDRLISPYTLVAEVRDGKVASVRSYLNDEETLRHLKLLR
jgi:ketosteroid isomerase-like protein